MPDYEFTLILDGDITDESVAAALFDAGCDDATFGVSGGVGYGEFIRESGSLQEAILLAVHQVEGVSPSLLVRRVEPDDLVTMTDIAARLDRTRESVRLLIAGRRGPGGFPQVISHSHERSRLWRWSDVAAWLELISPEEVEAARFIAALNAALDLRHEIRFMADEIATKEILSLI